MDMHEDDNEYDADDVTMNAATRAKRFWKSIVVNVANSKHMQLMEGNGYETQLGVLFCFCELVWRPGPCSQCNCCFTWD